ncbi:MAG: hypothetical protein AAGF31_00375 [Planctomycetota bacterium]
MKKTLFLAAGIVALSLLSTSSFAQETVLITDAFERETGNFLPSAGATDSDWGANGNETIGGVAGTVVQDYINTPTRASGVGGVDSAVGDLVDANGVYADAFVTGPADGDGEAMINFGAVAVDYNLATDPNVLAGGGYRVEFTGRRTGGFLSFFVGSDPGIVGTQDGGAAFGPVDSGSNPSDITFIFNDDGFGFLRAQVFEESVQDETLGAAADGTIFTNGLVTDEFDVTVEVLGPSGFDIGDTLTVSLNIDGVDLDINGDSTPGLTRDIVVDRAFAGFVGWSANSGPSNASGGHGGLLDDLVITALGTASGLPGDFNDDGFVNLIDYTIWRDNLGATEDGSVLMGNGDGGTVGGTDYTLWKTNYTGTFPPPGSGALTSTPEPTAAVLSVIAMLGLAGSRRRS